jgi:hypothetical protein
MPKKKKLKLKDLKVRSFVTKLGGQAGQVKGGEVISVNSYCIESCLVSCTYEPNCHTNDPKCTDTCDTACPTTCTCTIVCTICCGTGNEVG